MASSYGPVIVIDGPCDCEDDRDDREALELRKAYTDKFKTRRKLMILTLVTIIVVFLIILTSSVVYDVKNNPRDEFSEFSCNRSKSEEDLQCVQHLCPEGWEWDWEKHRCHMANGYDKCCADCVSRQLLCYNSTNKPSSCCPTVGSLGVAPGAYKDFCRKGFLWVEWKKRCLRTN